MCIFGFAAVVGDGLIVPNAMDGPGNIMQVPVTPGARYVYEQPVGQQAPVLITRIRGRTGSRRWGSTGRSSRDRRIRRLSHPRISNTQFNLRSDFTATA